MFEEHLDRLCDQWRELASYRSDLEHLAGIDPSAFWLELRKSTDGNDKPKFDVLADLMCRLHLCHCRIRQLALNAYFFQVNIVKTKQCETVFNRILARQAVKKGGTCHTWNPCTSLVEDVREGHCRKRYEQTLQLHVAQKTLNVNATEVVDFVDFD